MKSLIIFSIGVVVGIVATILVSFLISVKNQPNYGLYGLSVFPEKGECVISGGEIEVLQVMKSNMALAQTGNILDGIVILLINYDGKSYYDDQKIKIPSGQCARQIGTYQYTSRMDIGKTVPAVVIE